MIIVGGNLFICTRLLLFVSGFNCGLTDGLGCELPGVHGQDHGSHNAHVYGTDA